MRELVVLVILVTIAGCINSSTETTTTAVLTSSTQKTTLTTNLITTGSIQSTTTTSIAISIKQTTTTERITTTTLRGIVLGNNTIELNRKFETNEISFYVPENWRDKTGEYSQMGNFIAYLIGDGIGFPPMYNGENPLILNMWVMPEKASDLESLKKDFIDGYFKNPDREFPKDFQPIVKKIKLNSGEDAYYMHVRFYRKTKNLEQSRYDLITINPTNNKSYSMTLSVQYSGDYETAENNLKLNEFTDALFTNFQIK